MPLSMSKPNGILGSFFLDSVISKSTDFNFSTLLILFIDSLYVPIIFSIPIQFLFSFLATAQVVPEPEKGSSIRSPVLELDKITLVKRDSGFV